MARMGIPKEEVNVFNQLGPATQMAIKNKVNEYQDIFSSTFQDTVRTPLTQMRIDLKPGVKASRVGTRPRRYAPKELRFIKE